jgi:tubulin monoglycylase TTLL3/8
VLVTDWNPLTIWIYNECYVRFAATEYDPNSHERFTHLTNNTVSRKYQGDVEEEDEIDENMWSCDEFISYLNTTYGRDVYQEEIWPQIKSYVKAAL